MTPGASYSGVDVVPLGSATGCAEDLQDFIHGRHCGTALLRTDHSAARRQPGSLCAFCAYSFGANLFGSIRTPVVPGRNLQHWRKFAQMR